MTGIEDSALDKGLYRWFLQMRSLGNPVSGPVLQEKAIVFNNLFNGRKDFHASNGWLHKWKKRHQIRQLTITGERLSADEEGSANFSTGFCKFIGDHHYSRDQIYNADETGLMWKSLPSKTLVATYEKKAPRRKVLKDRVTIMICSNASGTHKIPLLVIGKVKKPRCFKNIKVLPVVYKAQRSGWMDRIIFKEWYTDVFLREIMEKHGQNARCVLLLDNAPSHPPAEELNLINDLCLYLPPNVTAISQPMDQGIIEKVKKIYKRQVLETILLFNDTERISDFFKTWNMINCCNTIAYAWDTVTSVNIKNAWKNLLKDEIQCSSEQLDTASFVRLIRQLPDTEEITAECTDQWLYDNNDPGWQILSDEELLNFDDKSLYGTPPDEDNEEIDAIQQEMIVEQAWTALDSFQQFYQTCTFCTAEDVLILERYRSNIKQLIIH